MGLLDSIFKKQNNTTPQSRPQPETEEQRQRRVIDKAAARILHSPIYKEDIYSQMIRNASYNPFNLTCDPAANRYLEFGDMVSIFKDELNSTISMTTSVGMPAKEAVKGYTFNMVESYYNNAGYVPKAMADAIMEQIYEALQQTQYCNCISLDTLKYEMYWAFTHR